MRIQERILLSLCRDPKAPDNFTRGDDWTIDGALKLLESKYPNLEELLSGRKVVDFGSGQGHQCVAIGKKYGSTVLGIDNNERFLKEAKANAVEHGVGEPQLKFVDTMSEDMIGNYDIVISQNAFEHFFDSGIILAEMAKLIGDDGKILITFGPPWFAPRGAHMQHFCMVPWVNVFFSEDTIMGVRTHFRGDGATKFDEVESGLNQMSLRKFEDIIANSGLKVQYKRFDGIRGFHFLCKIPIIRELFTNHVTVILTKT